MINLENKNLKYLFYQIMLFLVLIFSTNFLQSTILQGLFFNAQIIYYLFLLLFFCFILFKLVLTKHVDNFGIVCYFLFLAITIPLYSASISNITFNQPILFGLLSERSWILLISGIWIYYMVTNQKIKIINVERIFIFIAWFSLILFFFQNYIGGYDTFFNTVGGDFDIYRGRRFVFQKYFITFGIIYYFIKFSNTKKFYHLVYFLLFLLFILFVVKGRLYTLFIFFTLFSYTIINSKGINKLLSLIYGFIVLSLFIYFLKKETLLHVL